MRTSLLILLTLICIPAASAAGPWLGTASNGVAEYTANVHGTTTVVAAGSHRLTLTGKWGLPRVTMNNDVGGLSADGGTLVLAERDGGVHQNGELAGTTAFAVVGTKPLRLRTVVRLRGDFGFDALSPGGRMLFLVQHVSQEDLFRYRVRAYDLAKERLLPRVIADKRQRDWTMNGYPVGRASTRDGRWVYTFYGNQDNYPFVHALDTVNRTAICVGIPFDWAADQREISSATLQIKGGKLAIGDRFLLDRTTFEVTKT